VEEHMKHILLVITYLFLSFSVEAQSCSGEKIDKQISIFQAVKSAESFVYKQQDGFKKEGKASGQMLYTKHASLKWTPEQGEGGVFIIALDLRKDMFFIYHADNFEVKTTFYPGQFNTANCSIRFKITENEFTTLKIDDSNNIEIYIEYRESSDLAFKKMTTWLFKSRAR